MENRLDFRDLDAAVADLLKAPRDDATTMNNRNKVTASEKAEVRAQWRLPRESSDELAADETSCFAKELASTVARDNAPVTLRTAASPKRRSSQPRHHGHFMDIVHPSSDATLTDKPNHARAANQIAHGEQPTRRQTGHSRAPISSLSESTAAKSVSSEPSESLANLRDELSRVIPETAAPTPSAIKAPMQSPFLPDVKVDKLPLGATRPTGSVPTEELLPAYDNPSTDPIEPMPERELSEDNFISKFLADIKTKADQKPVVTETTSSSMLDHLVRHNAENAPVTDHRQQFDDNMVRPQYFDSVTAQIAEAPTPFHAIDSLVGDSLSPSVTKSHPLRWILAFVALLVSGFCLGAWWWLTH
ncbi:MAG: hypothetical protein WAW91_00995 [Candidatus Nanoperiomorbaceae bacterium]